jgi:hypothetical protein
MNPAPPVTKIFISRKPRTWDETKRSARKEEDGILLKSVLYPLVAEAKKGVARIQVPPKEPKITEGSAGRDELMQEGPDVGDARGVHMLMSREVPAKRDPLIVPLVGLLLAFSVISLIVQLLIAFS